MHGAAVVVTCFALVALLLAWSRWLAGRRLAAAGHVAMAIAAAAGAREVWDMGQQWRALTDLPFVFAVWLLRADADPQRVLPVLERARQRGKHLGPVDGTHGAAHYDLDAEDLRGLQRFWAEARALQLAEGPDPRFVSPTIQAPR